MEGTSLIIGRAESADLQIDSARVSREHAHIEIRDGRYILKDLGSTNHTIVNGQRIESVELADGDVILVGDSQVTFLMNSASRLRRMATQPIFAASTDNGRTGDTRSTGQDVRDAILSARRFHEALQQQFVAIEWKRVVQMPASATFAHWARATDVASPRGERNSGRSAPSKHLALRRIQSFRSAAVERAAAMDESLQLVVPVESWEAAEGDELLWHFEALRSAMGRGRSLMASLAASDAVDLPQVSLLCRRLRDRGVAIACHEFIGSGPQVHDLEKIQPDLLVLAAELSPRHGQQPASVAAGGEHSCRLPRIEHSPCHLRRGADRRRLLGFGISTVCSKCPGAAVADAAPARPHAAAVTTVG